MIRISGCQGASERISLSLATATFLENRNQLFYFFFDFFQSKLRLHQRRDATDRPTGFAETH